MKTNFYRLPNDMQLFFLVLLSVSLSSIGTIAKADPHFSTFKAPFLSGERKVTSQINYMGVAPDKMDVYVVYSDSRDEVVNAFNIQRKTGREPAGTAKCVAIRSGSNQSPSGSYNCSYVLPYENEALVPPGMPSWTRESFFLAKHGKNGKIFPPGTVVYYAWAKEFLPRDFSEHVTLNSGVQQFTMPKPLTIALMGDSFGSGEGAPNLKHQRERAMSKMWDDAMCHRSKYGGLEQGINEVINNRADLEIDYINVACSGAQIAHFQKKQKKELSKKIDPGQRKPSGKKKPQIEQVLDWLDRKSYPVLDAVVMSIGGNDIGFGSIIGTCMFTVGDCFEVIEPGLREELENLPSSYKKLNNKFSSLFGSRKKGIGRIFITQYPNPTRGENGKHCNTFDPNPFNYAGGCWGLVELGVSKTDFEYLDSEVVQKLNKAVASASRAQGWTLIRSGEGVANFGLCNCSGYFHTMGQSMAEQGDFYGSIHPNRKGYKRAYASVVSHKLSTSINNRQQSQPHLAITIGRTTEDTEDIPFSNITKSIQLMLETPPRRASDNIQLHRHYQIER